MTTDTPRVFARVPVGDHAGKRWRELSNRVLAAMRTYWASPDRISGPFADGMRDALDGEFKRRQKSRRRTMRPGPR